MNRDFFNNYANRGQSPFCTEGQRVLIGDGAIGTYLQTLGLWPTGSCPEMLKMTKPEAITKIHREYAQAGAQWLKTNTFGANPIKLESFGLENKTADLNKRGVYLAKKASPDLPIWGDIGPTGKLLQPLGEFSLNEIISAFYIQAKALKEEGTDGFLIETMGDLAESKAAVMAVRALGSNLKIACTLTFEPGWRTLSGDDAETIISVLQALNVDILGVNCGFGPDEMPEVLKQFAAFSDKPLLVQPNAGLPLLKNNQTIFPATPQDMAQAVEPLAKAGAIFIGGCCGTTPQHIEAMVKAAANIKAPPTVEKNFSSFSGFGQTVYVGPNQPLLLIGERINPTARKKLAENLRQERYDLVAKEAKSQIEAGASMIDLNVSLPVAKVPEDQRLKELTLAVQRIVKHPISLDTPHPQNMEAALKVMRGKPLLNSATGDDDSLLAISSLAAKYGSAILGLTLNKKGIPNTWQGRFAIAKYIVETALSHGVNLKDIYIDGLTLTAGASQSELPETLKLIRAVKEDLGVKTILGVSNVSHGLPLRPYLTTAFLIMAMEAGLDAALVNPMQEDLVLFTKAADVLTGRDKNAVKYINLAATITPRKEKSKTKSKAKVATSESPKPKRNQRDMLKDEILLGNKNIVVPTLKELIAQGMSPLDLVNSCIVSALNEAGERYDKKEYFLPQLLMAAEAAQTGLAYLHPLLQETGAQPQGTVVLATVKGDIHDIGKSIVKLMLENHGFSVIDLGKDVEPSLIVETALSNQADIIALSALMTTTMPQMQVVCQILEEKKLFIPVLVGGAIVNAEYAQEIGATYGADATDAVRLALKLLKKEGGT